LVFCDSLDAHLAAYLKVLDSTTNVEARANVNYRYSQLFEKSSQVLHSSSGQKSHPQLHRQLLPPHFAAKTADISKSNERTSSSPGLGGSLTTWLLMDVPDQQLVKPGIQNFVLFLDQLADRKFQFDSELWKQGIRPAIEYHGESIRAQDPTSPHISLATQVLVSQVKSQLKQADEVHDLAEALEEIEKQSHPDAAFSDEHSAAMEKGKKLRLLLTQPQHQLLSLEEQSLLLFAACVGQLDFLQNVQSVVRAREELVACYRVDTASDDPSFSSNILEVVREFRSWLKESAEASSPTVIFEQADLIGEKAAGESRTAEVTLDEALQEIGTFIDSHHLQK